MTLQESTWMSIGAYTYRSMHSSVAIPHLWSWCRVACCDRIVAPPQPGIICIICSREGDERARLSTATASDLNLRARQIHLCTSGALCLVERNRLDAHQVLTRWRILRDGEEDLGLFCKHHQQEKEMRCEDIRYAGHVSGPLVNGLPFALMLATLNQTFPAGSHVLMSALSGTFAI